MHHTTPTGGQSLAVPTHAYQRALLRQAVTR